MRAPAAPFALPLFGNLADVGIGKLADGLAKPPHQRMQELARATGEVMELQMGAQPWTVLSSPRAVHDAFVVRGGDFAGRPMVPSMAVSAGGGQGFSQACPDAGLRALRRAAFSELYGPAHVAESRHALDAEATALANHLAAVGTAELRPVLRRCVSNMVMHFAFSTRVPYSTEDAAGADGRTRELVELADAIWEQLTAPATTAADLLAPALAGAAHGELRRLVGRRDALLRLMIAERTRAGPRTAPGARPDMLDRLLSAGLTDSQVLYSLVDLFIAGVNTVSTALEWMLLLTARHSFAQVRARSHALNDSAEYVRALLDETLRYKPPLLLPRMALRDTTVLGYDVPAGRVVFANSYALSHAQELWSEPSLFRPSRWSQEERGLVTAWSGPSPADGAAAFSAEERCKFVPFSVGQRACPGERLARTELEAATLALLRAVEWEAIGPIDLREDFSLTLVPTASQSLRFRRRPGV